MEQSVRFPDEGHLKRNKSGNSGTKIEPNEWRRGRDRENEREGGGKRERARESERERERVAAARQDRDEGECRGGKRKRGTNAFDGVGKKLRSKNAWAIDVDSKIKQ